MRERQRVVVADEEAIWRKNIGTWLGTAGYHVVGEVADGVAALNVIRRCQVELAILSAHLPGINGLEIAAIVREDKMSAVILTCSRLWQNVLDKAKDIRVFGLLVKPFDETVLIPAATLALNSYQEVTSLEREVQELRTTLETRKVIEKAKGLLMESLGLSESEAFRRIQKLSMDKRLPMREVAEAIVLCHGVTGRLKK